MTKKDYELIAKAVYYEHLDSRNNQVTLARIVDSLTRELELGNPRFDKVKFLKS